MLLEKIKIVESQIEHCNSIIEIFTNQKSLRLNLLKLLESHQKVIS